MKCIQSDCSIQGLSVQGSVRFQLVISLMVMFHCNFLYDFTLMLLVSVVSPFQLYPACHARLSRTSWTYCSPIKLA